VCMDEVKPQKPLRDYEVKWAFSFLLNYIYTHAILSIVKASTQIPCKMSAPCLDNNLKGD
jgi:hypothetical protein